MSLLNEIAAGGQTWAHRVRMLKQVVKIILLCSLSCSALVFTFKCFRDIPVKSYKAVWYSLQASIYHLLDEKMHVDQAFWKSMTNRPYQKESSPELILRMTKAPVKVFFDIVRLNAYFSLLGFFAFSGLFILFFLIRGKLSKSKKRLSGIGEMTDMKLAHHLKLKNKASSMKIGQIPLLKQKSKDHILVTGVTGSGKTNCLKQILMQVRKRGERVVIVDTTGSFVSHFYRPEKDILFNPYDARSEEWSPWCECTEDYHYEQLVNSLIPNMHYDNFFPEAGRAVLYSALRKAEVLGETDIRLFVNSMLRKPIAELYDDLQDTDAAVYVDPKGDKTTLSVRATISNTVRHFRSLRSSEKPFSIRNWILSDSKEDQWLFITCTTEQRRSIKNLISLWFSIAMNAMKARDLTSKQDPIWFVLDELHSLQKLEYLEEGLVEIRKYLGTLVIATQNLSQLDQLYGSHATKAMIDQCGTKVCFRQGDADIAARMSKFFGEEEYSEVQEGLSYGAHEMRDGVNLSKVKKIRPTIPSTKILELNNLEAYVKLSGKLPAAKTKFRYSNLPKIAEGFLLDES